MIKPNHTRASSMAMKAQRSRVNPLYVETSVDKFKMKRFADVESRVQTGRSALLQAGLNSVTNV
jgi:hypothetical protein